MINFNPNVNAAGNPLDRLIPTDRPDKTSGSPFAETAKKLGDMVQQVDEMQQTSDTSIKDLLAGKNPDITSVVSDVAKADMSFKLLVGVRNKLIEAYKQTMNMQL